MESHQLDIDSWWLQIQIHKQTTCGPTAKNNVTVVRNENGLGRNKLRRYYPQVELWRRSMGRNLPPKIYWENPGAISPSPTKIPQDSQHPAPPTKFTRTTPTPPSPDESPSLDEKGIKRIHQICGSILWYRRACDIKTTKALNDIGREQAKATETTRMWSNWLLDYFATHPTAKIRYWQSDMRLIMHSDSSFLVEWDAKSNYGGYLYLVWNQNDGKPQQINRAVDVNASLLPPRRDISRRSRTWR